MLMFSDVHDMHPRDWFILVELHNAYLFISSVHICCLRFAFLAHARSFTNSTDRERPASLCFVSRVDIMEQQVCYAFGACNVETGIY